LLIAQENFGVLPWTGPLSDESAADYRHLPTIALMKLPAAKRPRGKRDRLRRFGGLR
jgi:hypothetical protein